jgi:hypothetical protein
MVNESKHNNNKTTASNSQACAEAAANAFERLID